ncbi:MAG: hypothetical protein N3E51_00340 [Candidatus Micrarchaeota archaeon]|nr:hypothetical protein [Candidatus Micrarchaeota archaeon]
MEPQKKLKGQPDLSSLPAGIKEIAEIPQEQEKQAPLLCEEKKPILLPPPSPQKAQRQKTALEVEFDALVSQRQSIIELLKQKNEQASQARKKIAEIMPALRGKGASHTMKLAEEAARIEFSISTEAYTPKKEKELLKRLRQIRQELSKHKELDSARRALEEARKNLRAVMSEIRSLEHELAQARKKCDEKYAQLVAERKAAYEQRLKLRQEREKKRQQLRQARFEQLKQRVREEKRRQRQAELEPYMKKHDDTVSMEEIVEFERKEKKKGEEDKV